MKEQGNSYHSNGTERESFYDPEAQKRFDYVVVVGQKVFSNSALLEANADKQISSQDLILIEAYHKEVSPTNPTQPCRVQKEDRPQAKDASFYANWDLPGGPLESIELASNAAGFIVQLIQENIKNEDQHADNWSKETIQKLQSLDPNHAAAAGALHDEGREITHQFGVNEYIGNALLKKIGIREDIRAVLPNEEVMLAKPEGNETIQDAMDRMIRSLDPEAVIVRIADEFGKRAPGTNRLYQPEDYDAWDRNTWAERYLNNPLGGRPTDDLSRSNMQLHVDNVPYYFAALDNWLTTLTKINLKELAMKLEDTFGPTLRPLS